MFRRKKMIAIRRVVQMSLLTAIPVVVLACTVARGGRHTDLCGELKKFAAAETRVGGGSVTVGRSGEWMIDHAKFCRRKDTDPAADAFCAYLMEHTSTEFMEATVNGAMACLQGQRIVGIVGNTGIANWDGKAHFYAPKLNVEGAEFELNWHLTAFGAWDDYVEFAVQTHN
jgi:hypothetical protein